MASTVVAASGHISRVVDRTRNTQSILVEESHLARVIDPASGVGYLQLTGFQKSSTEELEKRFVTTNRPTSLLKRIATVEEVANMVVYVCSPQASATSGAALRVDGGVVRSIG